MLAQKIGIDKLSLYTADFKVKEVKPQIFGIDRRVRQGSTTEELPYLLTDAAGNRIQANGIYHNSPIASYSINHKGLNVTFNPNKIVHPYHLTEINTAKYNESITQVEHELSSIGIHTNMDFMKVTRIDLAKQSEMDLCCYHYADAFKMMRGKRMKQRSMEGYNLINNKQKQVCFYDKENELKSYGIGNIMQGEKNLMRAEIRLLKSDATKRLFSVCAFNEFKKFIPSDINSLYNSFLNKNVFSSPADAIQMQLDFSKEVEIFKYLREKKGRSAFIYLLAMNDIEDYILKLGGIDKVYDLSISAGISERQARRHRDQARQMIEEKARIDKKKNIITPASLIEELKYKFAA